MPSLGADKTIRGLLTARDSATTKLPDTTVLPVTDIPELVVAIFSPPLKNSLHASPSLRVAIV